MGTVSIASVGCIGGNAAAAAANTAAINAAAQPGVTLVVPPGKWYFTGNILLSSCSLIGRERDVCHLIGVDTLHPGTPQASIQMLGIAPALKHLTLTILGATVRGSTNATNGVTCYRTKGHDILDVAVNGPASAGLFCSGAEDGCISHSAVVRSLADGISHTDASVNCEVDHCEVDGSQDDYFSVVSYQATGLCQNIYIHDGRGRNQKAAGRGLSVAGGQNVLYRRMTVGGCVVYGIIVLADANFKTVGATGCIFDNCNVISCGAGGGIIDGVEVYGMAGFPTSDITFKNCSIQGYTGKKFVVQPTYTSAIDTSGIF